MGRRGWVRRAGFEAVAEAVGLVEDDLAVVADEDDGSGELVGGDGLGDEGGDGGEVVGGGALLEGVEDPLIAETSR